MKNTKIKNFFKKYSLSKYKKNLKELISKNNILNLKNVSILNLLKVNKNRFFKFVNSYQNFSDKFV